MTPSNARVDILSSSFGRAADYGEDDEKDPIEEEPQQEEEDDIAIDFTPSKAGRPLVEPHFGTQYWSHTIPTKVIERWSKASEPQMPPEGSNLSLPPLNPFVPKKFALKALPPDDSHHPLLFCSLNSFSDMKHPQ